VILRDKQAHPEMARAARANAFAVRELRIRAAQAKKGEEEAAVRRAAAADLQYRLSKTERHQATLEAAEHHRRQRALLAHVCCLRAAGDKLSEAQYENSTDSLVTFTPPLSHTAAACAPQSACSAARGAGGAREQLTES
jgi:hypothetical protein